MGGVCSVHHGQNQVLESTMVFRKRDITGEFAIQQNIDISKIYRYGAIRYRRIFYCIIRYEFHIDIFDTISAAYFIAKIRYISIRYRYTVSLPALSTGHINKEDWRKAKTSKTCALLPRRLYTVLYKGTKTIHHPAVVPLNAQNFAANNASRLKVSKYFT
ncbi:hypothetical protein RvY_02382 [Ramazzottius varieornatus]|uniref:Uncharacterized protein n=1 Tax=Ramazzottius varieornatus TaxID=947166 RepID=A0A1D1UU26_RAMVA|nr:hypothetical protein RvY_02382 [Ramazzottius varieornatus]